MLLPLLVIWNVIAYATPAPPGQSQEAGNSSLLWGPYRPNLYVGIRPRGPEPLLMGLMWGNADKSAGIPDSKYSILGSEDLSLTSNACRTEAYM